MATAIYDARQYLLFCVVFYNKRFLLEVWRWALVPPAKTASSGEAEITVGQTDGQSPRVNQGAVRDGRRDGARAFVLSDTRPAVCLVVAITVQRLGLPPDEPQLHGSWRGPVNQPLTIDAALNRTFRSWVKP